MYSLLLATRIFRLVLQSNCSNSASIKKMNAALRNQILRIIPADKHRNVLPLFYEGLGFHPLYGPDDEILHLALLEMVRQHQQESNSTSSVGPTVKPLHLAINIVLNHKNERWYLPVRRGETDSEDESPANRAIVWKFNAAIKMVTYLLEQGADPNCQFKDGKTAVYRIVDHMRKFFHLEFRKSSHSSYYPASKLLALILGYGAEVNQSCKNLSSDDPFLIALDSENEYAMKLFIEHGYELDRCTKVSPPPRIFMCWLDVYDLLIRAGIFDLHEENEDDETILHKLIHIGQFKTLDKVKLLVESGSDVNNVDFEGHSVLYTAVRLLEYRPNFNMILYAELLRYLISRGAKVFDESLEGQLQPITEIIFRGDWAIVQFFLEEFYKLGHSVDRLKTCHPLPVAAFNPRKEVIEGLLRMGLFDIDQRNHYGDTALHCTCTGEMKGKHTKLLLEWGANVNIANNENETPLHYCANFGGKLIHLLLWAGADVNAKTIRNKLPLDLAAKHCKFRKVASLISHIALLDHQGLEIDPRNHTLIQHSTKKRELYKKCKEELEISKKTFLHTSVTCYDFLIFGRDKWLRNLMSIVAVRDFFKNQDTFDRFPIYGEQIKKRFVGAKKEYELLVRATHGLKIILKVDCFGFHLVYDMIMSSLTKQDLVNLGNI